MVHLNLWLLPFFSTAWLLIRNPKIKILTASYSKTVALELSQKTRTMMQSNKFLSFFPYCTLKDDDNTKSNYKTSDGGGRFITSTGSNILGVHADIIICDDIPKSNNDILRVGKNRC